MALKKIFEKKKIVVTLHTESHQIYQSCIKSLLRRLDRLLLC